MTYTIEDIMAKKEEKYEHVKKYEKRAKIAEDMIRMTDRTHRKAFHAYESTFISDNGRGVDLEKAKDSKLRQEALEKMCDVYLSKAKEVLNASPADDFEKELLMRAYAGTTKEQMKHLINEHKENFDFKLFNDNYKPQFMKQISVDLSATASGHLKDEHVKDIVEYIGLNTYDVDYTKVNLEEAVNYLENFRRSGTISPKSISDKHKKKKAA